MTQAETPFTDPHQVTGGAFTVGLGQFGELGPRNRGIDLPPPADEPRLLTLTIELRGSKPSIWRRLSLPGDLTRTSCTRCSRRRWAGQIPTCTGSSRASEEAPTSGTSSRSSTRRRARSARRALVRTVSAWATCRGRAERTGSRGDGLVDRQGQPGGPHLAGRGTSRGRAGRGAAAQGQGHADPYSARPRRLRRPARPRYHGAWAATAGKGFQAEAGWFALLGRAAGESGAGLDASAAQAHRGARPTLDGWSRWREGSRPSTPRCSHSSPEPHCSDSPSPRESAVRVSSRPLTSRCTNPPRRRTRRPKPPAPFRRSADAAT